MEDAIKSAVELHRALQKKGIELNPAKGRDAQLHTELAGLLGLREKGFTEALELSDLSGEDYLRALISISQPFALMFREIWSYLGRHCAPVTGESLRIRFGFKKDDSTEIDWDQFREYAKVAQQIWSSAPVFLWPSQELMELTMALIQDSLQQRRSGYRHGQRLVYAPIVGDRPEDEMARTIREMFQSILDYLADRYQLASDDSRSLPELQRLEDEMHPDEDPTVRELNIKISDFVSHWQLICSHWPHISDSSKQKALTIYNSKVAPKIKKSQRPAWRNVYAPLDVLNLPFWKHRWHTYEVWAAVKALEALADYGARPVIKSGQILLDAANSAVIATFGTEQPIYAHVQSTTALPRRLGKRGNIKPDLRFSLDDPATNAKTLGIVEFKQRKTLTAGHASEVLVAYKAGTGKLGGVVMINYDQIPDVELPERCSLLGNVQPGYPSKVAEYQQIVVSFFETNDISVSKNKAVVLLDVSGSMGSEYQVAAAQDGLRLLLGLPNLTIFRFNSGLLPGGDWKGGDDLTTSGGTELGSALREVYQLTQVGIPDKLLIVTDGQHDHPTQLLERAGEWKECMPADIPSMIDWLSGR